MVFVDGVDGGWRGGGVVDAGILVEVRVLPFPASLRLLHYHQHYYHFQPFQPVFCFPSTSLFPPDYLYLVFLISLSLDLIRLKYLSGLISQSML